MTGLRHQGFMKRIEYDTFLCDSSIHWDMQETNCFPFDGVRSLTHEIKTIGILTHKPHLNRVGKNRKKG